VKNYTGDRLNFGLAAERAKALGRKVSMVVVDDDIALPDLPQPRGVAGTLFVHKIAGAMAEAGEDLDTIAAAAQQVIGKVATIGMSLDTCTVPGSTKENRIGTGKAELGLGIHGEPGVQQIDFAGAEAAMATIVDKLKNYSTGNMVAILNNLGSTTPLEMSVLAQALNNSGIAKYIIGPAPMMTSLDMHGFSVSLMEVSKEELGALTDTVLMPAWPGLSKLGAPLIIDLPDGLTPIEPIPSKNDTTRCVIENVLDLLIASENELNELDTKSGDGDTGSTLATAARALKSSLDRMPLADLTQLFPALGNELSQTMGGSSGVILAIYFNAAGDACANGIPVQKALMDGLRRVSDVGGAQVGDRTMIDALAPALEALPNGIGAAAAAARQGADQTAKIHRAKAGRAAYVPEENLKGHNDPGAEAVALLFGSLAKEMEA
jgi:dihydroxyacetone kinase